MLHVCYRHTSSNKLATNTPSPNAGISTMHAPPYRTQRGSLPLNDGGVLAAVEKAYLAGLDGPQVQSWAIARIEELLERVRSLKSLYNEAASINRTLPNEILMEIFSKLRPSEWLGDSGLRLAHICRLWRRLLLTMPEFWVDLLAKPRVFAAGMTQRQGDRLGFYLGITGSRPITLSLESSARRKAGLPLRMAQVVAPWRHRIAALTISSICRRDDAFLRAFILTGLPSLERLCVGYGEGTGSEKSPSPAGSSIEIRNRINTYAQPTKSGSVQAGRTRIVAQWKLERVGAVSLLADLATLFSQPFLKVTTLQIDIASLLSTNDVKCSLCALLVAFANLVRLQVRGCDGRRDIIPLLKERAEPSGDCTCPRLEALQIDWLCAEDQAFKPRKDAWGLAAPDGEWYRFGPAVFATFCDIVERMLAHRRSSGAPLKRLVIGVVPGQNSLYFDDKRWDLRAWEISWRTSMLSVLTKVRNLGE
ncbi:hypothetical protein OH76DRAFT_1480486 [Lentinus brumalis]|uniref:F-box domain-containing protein n=1 Tax=Lentinus brumalis TaxID=2498619 RepID=A0A371DK40_9APHY|nr:hypothetical protein OH76DRAFT_1480486 [Polyporus brumalis]